MRINKRPVRGSSIWRWIGMGLIALGAVLLMICLPVRFWGVTFSLILALIGVLLTKI